MLSKNSQKWRFVKERGDESIWGNQSKYTLKKHLWWKEQHAPETGRLCKSWEQSVLWKSVPETLWNTLALSHLNPLKEVKLLWTRSKIKSPFIKVGSKVNDSMGNVHCIHLKTHVWKMVWHYLLMRLILYEVFSLTEQINH